MMIWNTIIPKETPIIHYTEVNSGAGYTKVDGGAGRDRTDDLKLAKLPLSQLSYGPIPRENNGGPGKIWTSDLTLIKRAL